MGYSKVSHIIFMYLVSFPKFLLLVSECLCFETRYCCVSQLTSNSQSPCFSLQSVWDYNHVLPCLTFVRGIMLSSQNEASSNFSPCPFLPGPLLYSNCRLLHGQFWSASHWFCPNSRYYFIGRSQECQNVIKISHNN